MTQLEPDRPVPANRDTRRAMLYLETAELAGAFATAAMRLALSYRAREHHTQALEEAQAAYTEALSKLVCAPTIPKES